MSNNKWSERIYPIVRIGYRYLKYRDLYQDIKKWKQNSGITEFNMSIFRNHVVKYLSSMSTPNGVKFSESSQESIYALVYQIMTEGMLDVSIKDPQKKLEILNSAQYADGLFYDSATINYGYIQGDGWGARHFVPQAIIAYERLGAVPKKEFSYISPLYNEKNMTTLLESLDWRHPWGSSNIIMNYLTVMQYSRDRMGDTKAARSLGVAFNWLLKNIREDCGMWFRGKIDNQMQMYEAVRAAYHIYPLFIYDGIEIPFQEKVIDKILELQNRVGGFDTILNSSACQDIDAIDPLIRFNIQTGYRTDEVKKCIAKSLDWVLHNQMGDGGFVFSLGESFNYGHRNLRSTINESNMFATWFRTLSVIYMYDYLHGMDSKLLCLPGYEMPVRGKGEQENEN